MSVNKDGSPCRAMASQQFGLSFAVNGDGKENPPGIPVRARNQKARIRCIETFLFKLQTSARMRCCGLKERGNSDLSIEAHLHTVVYRSILNRFMYECFIPSRLLRQLISSIVRDQNLEEAFCSPMLGSNRCFLVEAFQFRTTQHLMNLSRGSTAERLVYDAVEAVGLPPRDRFCSLSA